MADIKIVRNNEILFNGNPSNEKRKPPKSSGRNGPVSLNKVRNSSRSKSPSYFAKMKVRAKKVINK